jgi:Aspartyl protease
MKPTSIIVAVILTLEFLFCRIVAGADVPEMVQCPWTVLHGHLYIHAALSGQTQTNWWLVDTGSPVCQVNAELAKRVAGSIGQTKTQDGRTFAVLQSPGIDVAGQSLGPFDYIMIPSLGALDANRLNPRVGFTHPFETGGVFGLNFLIQHRARLNFPTQTLFLTSRKDSSEPKPTGVEGFTAVPIELTTTGRIGVSGSIGSQLYSFMVDTGGRRSVLDWKVKEANQIPVRPNGILIFEAANKGTSSWMGELPNFKLGSLDVSRKSVQFARLSVFSPGFSHPFGGIIGEEFLWDHQAILDIGGRTLYLK